MGNWKFPPDGGHMEKPSKIYYQTMTKKDVEERLKVNDILLIPFDDSRLHPAAAGHNPFHLLRIAAEDRQGIRAQFRQKSRIKNQAVFDDFRHP